MGSGRHERITVPGNLLRAGQDSEREFEATTSEVRALVPPFAVPWLMVTHEELRDLPIDPRAAFLVSLIDGHCSIAMIADVAGMPIDEVVATFAKLLQLGAIELRDPH